MRKAAARFWQVDFHVHTPASKDVTTQQYGPASPEDVVRTAVEAGLDAIAITDHNTVEWCSKVREAAEDQDLVVIPGVEISTTEGHLLALFEVTTPQRDLEDFLSSLGVASRDHGRLDLTTSGGFLETASAITEAGGLAIPAHVDKEKGLLKLPVPAHIKEILGSDDIAAVEVVESERIDEVRRKTDRELAVVRGSDAIHPGQAGHRLTALGERRTWIKAGTPDLVGIRHALADPALRVRTAAEEPAQHTYVKQIAISGGFLDGEVIDLSQDQSCLLGGTGTGKSLVLELIRFGLAQQTDEASFPAIRDEVESRLQAALGLNGSVELVVATNSGEAVVRRAYTGRASAPPDFVAGDSTLAEIPPIRAFSQGEVIEYARNLPARMGLVDAQLDLERERVDEAQVIGKIDQNGEALAAVRGELGSARSALKELSDAKERASDLAELFDAEIVKSQSDWTREATVIRRLEGVVPDGEIEDDEDLPDEVFGESVVPENADLFTRAQSVLDEYRESVGAAREALERARSSARSGLREIADVWRTRKEGFETKLSEEVSRKDTGREGLAALRKTLRELQEKVAELEALQERVASQMEPRLVTLTAEREELVQLLHEARSSRQEKRARYVADLNRRMVDAVRLKLLKRSDVSAYRLALQQLARGSGMRGDTIEAIASSTSPIRLVRSFLEGDSNGPAGAAGVKPSQVDTLFDHISSRGLEEELLKLQHIEIADTLSIEFRGTADGEYRPIESVAHGEKCTAILVIALADGQEPLIVDQPEDALHAPWIEAQLVDRLRDLRGTRQFIFATRSPGLVVSADAELIITMRSDASRGSVEACGSLELHDLNRLALYHLEGGPHAFDRRAKKLARSISSR